MQLQADHVKLFLRTYPADKNFYIIHGIFQKFFILAAPKTVIIWAVGG